jgi:hypothetical protein
MAKKIGAERGALVHQSCQNRAGKHAETADSDEGFLCPQNDSGEEAKGRRWRRSGAFIAALGVEGKLGFGAGARDQTEGKAAVREEEIKPEVGDDMWARDVSEGRGERTYSFGIRPGWAVGLFGGWAE